MSTRALRKLKETQNKAKSVNVKEETGSEDNESENENEDSKCVFRNKFDLLNLNDYNPPDDDDGEEEKEKETNEITKPQSKSSKNKKKKSKKQQQQDPNEFKFVDEDEFFTSSNLKNQSTISSTDANSYATRRILQIDSKNLNYDYEMVRMFGAKVVKSDKANVRSGKRAGAMALKSSRYSIVNRKPTWPPIRPYGLQMKLLNEDALKQNEYVLLEFTFEHAKEYQKVQFDFLDAVDSLNHNNIITVLHGCPYHVDSLIQLSDVSRMSDDTQMAADLIERALYAFQCAFHPAFSFQKNNYKLDYCRVENRGLFICLFKHALFVGSKACYRTALELTKLLLSLDIDADPLAALLMIDFYALRSHQYKYLIEFYDTYLKSKDLHLLPNMLFSVALANFYLAKETNNKKYEEEADRLLKDALVKFPGLLMQLLEKCSVVPDKEVENHWIFAKTTHLSLPEGLKYLFNIYSIRMNCEWKINEVLFWLEKTVKDIIKSEKELGNSIKEYKAKFKSIFAKAPVNILRHIIVCDSKELAVALPPDFASSALYMFDPLPPNNSIVTYKRPERPRTRAAYANESSLLTFFRSILPNFNSQETVAEGAEDTPGARQVANQLGDIVNQLRGLLVNLQENNQAGEDEEQLFEENFDNNNQNDNNENEDNEFD